jgi:hypothetical protein
MSDYTVQTGDCCSSVARQNGLPDYHALYDASENSPLRSTRPNPNQLNPGDTITVPPRATPRTGATDATHRFVTDAHPVKVRIALVDQGDRPVANVTCVLRFPTGAAAISTDGNGLLQHQVDARVTTGTLQVQFPAPTAGAAASGGSTAGSAASGTGSGGSASPPAYPAAIVASSFIDARDDTFIGAPPTNHMTWNLHIGALACHGSLEGVQGRLSNLGFGQVTVDGNPSDALTAAVRAYQTRYRLTVNGDWNAIKDDLKTRHDQP